eukprot:1160828-Pelagomonas_calceolata.AAC.3
MSGGKEGMVATWGQSLGCLYLIVHFTALSVFMCSCRAAITELEEEEAEFEAAKQSVRGLRALIAAGVVHRQVVDGLVSCEAPSLESFEWLRQVRHYWDSETDVLYVAFAQVCSVCRVCRLVGYRSNV